MLDMSFYKGKRVLVTGHTGFKGAWLSKILTMYGADVTGFALEPVGNPSLFSLLSLEKTIDSRIGDIRNLDALKKVFEEVKPELVFHLAAQPLVRESYKKPVVTYETNVMGTVNILDCVRMCSSVKSMVNITTDKVYHNREWEWGYREDDVLNGFDPYSNSKSCSELITQSYRKSFFENKEGNIVIPVSTARAGNVIGGGDFADDRIIPDCIRATQNKQDIVLRNPWSIRPYQHVMEPLYAYLLIAAKQHEDHSYADSYNVGPDDGDCLVTADLVSLFIKYWGDNIKWINKGEQGPHEAQYLKLDCSRIKTRLGWKPRWNIETGIEKTVEWTKCWLSEGDVKWCMETQIEDYLAGVM